MSRTFSRLLLLVVIAAASLGILAGVRAQSASSAQGARETGYAVKKPVIGGACLVCPWGVEADFVKTVMKSSGYDVQVCHNCAGGPQEARIVANAKMPPALTNPIGPGGIPIPPPPNGPVDFGVTEATYLSWAYQGSHMFKPDGPKKDLRLIGVIQHPSYYMVAVKADSGITDLSQIKEKGMPVKIITGVDEAWEDVLEYYGINKEWVESHGGRIGVAIRPDVRKDFDVIISGGTLENVPEWNIWYEASQKYDLKYLELPQDLLAKMAKDWDMQPGTVPLGLLHGMDHPFPTVINAGGDAVYGRTDMPDDFAYALAKAMDEQQDKLQWTIVNLSYNPHTVWKAFDVPLHPGAAKYYKERGYMN